MKTKYLSVLFSASLISSSAYAAPVSGYMEGWNTLGDTAGWDANTTVSSIFVQPHAGSLTDGYLETRGNAGNSFDIGANTQLSNATGDFGGGVWNVSVDLAFLSEGFNGAGSFDNAWLRFRYQDSTQNGWNYSLSNIFDTDWNTFSVMFDTSWDDATAMVNGWLPDNLSIDPGAIASESWATTMSDVYTTEIRLSGEGLLIGGIDNFELTAVPVPAAVWLLGSGLLGLVAVARRKRS